MSLPSRVTKLKERRIRRSRKPAPTLDEMLAQCTTDFELTDEDRTWDSMPAVGAERFWEPAQQRLSLARRIELRKLLPNRSRRRLPVKNKPDDCQN